MLGFHGFVRLYYLSCLAGELPGTKPSSILVARFNMVAGKVFGVDRAQV